MRNTQLLLLFALLPVIGACDNSEFFGLEHPIEPPWLNATEFDAAAVGAYYALTGNGGSRSIMAHRRLASSFTADVGVYLEEAAGNADARSVYGREHTEIDMFNNGIFRASYGAIGAANTALDFVAENDGNPFPFDPNSDQVPRIAGELHFIRAYAYWSLAKAYAPPYDASTVDVETELPYRVNAATNLEQAVTSEQATVGQLYDLIVADLQKAKEMLPEKFDPDLGHPDTFGKGRATKYAAAALLSRVLFQMGRFDEAAQEASFVIDSGEFDLSQDPIEAFNKFDDGRGDETIWYYNIGAPGSDGLREGSNWKVPQKFALYNWTDDSSWQNDNSDNRVFAASDAFLLQAGWIDESLNETLKARNDKRYTQLWVRVPPAEDPRFQGLPNRPFVWNNKYYRGPRSDQSNVVMLRLAELYLTRALVRFRNGDPAGAAADLNEVRERAWDAEAAGAAYVPVTAGEITEEMIHTERMIEMAFEGDRTPYLQALKMDIPNGDRGPGSVTWDDEGLRFVIPAREKELNQSF